MVETVVAFGLFLVVAAVTTWSLSSAFSAKAHAQTRTALSTVVSSQLDEVTLVPFADLLSGQFVVPAACDATVQGIAGTSCVNLGDQVATVAYRFASPSRTQVCTAPSADAAATVGTYGHLQVQACVVSVTSRAFTKQNSTGAERAVPAQTRTVLPQHPGFVPAGRSVDVHVTGALDELGTRHVLLVDAADPSRLRASAGLEGSTAHFSLPSVAEDSGCTAASPCVLALSTGVPHTRTAVPDAGAEFPSTVQVADTGGPGAVIIVDEHSTAQVRASLTVTLEPAAVVTP